VAVRKPADKLAAGEHRRLARRLHPERAVLDAHPRPAGAERLAGPRLGIRVPDRRADQAEVPVGEPDSPGVGDHDERRRRAVPGRLGHALHYAVRPHAARVARDDRLLQPGLGGEALGDRKGPLLVLPVQLAAQVPLDDDKPGRHRDHEDRGHHDDDLGRQALPQQAPRASSHALLSVTTV
jgi:hypothetical protein